MAAANLNGLAEALVSLGFLTEKVATDAVKEATKQKNSFVSYLVDNRLLEADVVAMVSSATFGLPLVDLNSLDASIFPITLISEKIIRENTILPIYKRGARLFLCVMDPTNIQVLDSIKFSSGLTLELVLASETQLQQAINQCLDDGSDLGLEGNDLDLEYDDEQETSVNVTAEESVNDVPIVKFANKILTDAIKAGVSDIHIEPYETKLRIRYRIDGILREAGKPPKNLTARLISRIKIMAKMDISERRLPQDGRIKLKLSKFRSIDFRVNTLPTLWGEKICLRILDSDAAKLSIDKLGFEDIQKKLFLEALARPQGMILVTGPTGSGKTVSLYTGLNILNTLERNISTAEDPVEINLGGINQVNVNAKIGFDFSTALRAFLRQDPDVVMVGEIRDLETAEIAIKAAQTGHLVLSTLHTNSATETLTRLHNMGIPYFNIATSINLIIAQRLARRLCPHCKKRLEIPDEALIEFGFTAAEIPDLQIYAPKGCSQCHEGYKGRVGIYEVVKITDSIARAIMKGSDAMELADQAREEGFPSLRAASLKKVKAGLTSLEEINRITTG